MNLIKKKRTCDITLVKHVKNVVNESHLFIKNVNLSKTVEMLYCKVSKLCNYLMK